VALPLADISCWCVWTTSLEHINKDKNCQFQGTAFYCGVCSSVSLVIVGWEKTKETLGEKPDDNMCKYFLGINRRYRYMEVSFILITRLPVPPSYNNNLFTFLSYK